MSWYRSRRVTVVNADGSRVSFPDPEAATAFFERAQALKAKPEPPPRVCAPECPCRWRPLAPDESHAREGGRGPRVQVFVDHKPLVPSDGPVSPDPPPVVSRLRAWKPR